MYILILEESQLWEGNKHVNISFHIHPLLTECPSLKKGPPYVGSYILFSGEIL